MPSAFALAAAYSSSVRIPWAWRLARFCSCAVAGSTAGTAGAAGAAGTAAGSLCLLRLELRDLRTLLRVLLSLRLRIRLRLCALLGALGPHVGCASHHDRRRQE